MTTLLPTTPPRDVLEGGPLVTRRASTGSVELDRSGMTRVAKAALLLVERYGSRDRAATHNRMAKSTVQALVRMDLPWVISHAVIARLEQALELPQGAVLRGEYDEPRGEVGRTTRRRT